MRNFKEAILYYDIEDRIEYQLYADFLRLAGIFVWEKCTLFESGDQIAQEDAEPETLIFSVQSREPSGIGYISDKTIQEMSLNGLLDAWKDLLEETEYKQAFQKLLDIFVNEDLLRAGATLQFFRKKDELVEKAGECFEHACRRFQKLIENNEDVADNKHIRYALIYCGQKANLARNICRMPGYMSTSVLAEQCLDLIDKRPEFSNVWVLLGLVYEFVNEKVLDAVDAFKRAGEAIGDRPYASSIYYWLGKRCENLSKEQSLSNRAYRIAYRMDQKYRVIYKVAWCYEMKYDYENAAKYYRECLNRIRKKEKLVDPLEQEYQFKTLVKLGYIYLKELDLPKCISLFQEALELRGYIQQGCDAVNEYTKYYYELYGKEEAAHYIHLELSRMQTAKIDQYLALAKKKWG